MSKQLTNKASSCLENILCRVINILFNTPFNWSLVLVATALWSISELFAYSASGNFNMLVVMNEYIRIFSVLAIIAGFIKNNDRSKLIIGIGIISFLLSLLSVVMSKTIIMKGLLGGLLLTPLNIFCFLILMKNLWNVGVLNNEVQSR